jgi:hypothetical protein
MNSAPMASSTEKMRSVTCNARYGGLDMAAGLPSLNTEMSAEPLWCAVYANSSLLNLAKCATSISGKNPDTTAQNP